MSKNPVKLKNKFLELIIFGLYATNLILAALGVYGNEYRGLVIFLVIMLMDIRIILKKQEEVK